MVAAIWFASNGVEALRTALNRAYRQRETRSFVVLRLQSLGLVLLGAIILLSYTFLVVLAPLALEALRQVFPKVEAFFLSINIARYALAGSLLVIGLFMTHWLLPSGRRSFQDIWPGVLATLVLWIIAGSLFGAYLARFANYVSTYGGLAGIMTALIFLYICALVFILGGELNAAISRHRAHRLASPARSSGGLILLRRRANDEHGADNESHPCDLKNGQRFTKEKIALDRSGDRHQIEQARDF